MLVAALLGAGAEIAIPLLTKAAIDGPIAASARTGSHSYALLIPIGLAAIGLGVAEVALNLLRRWAQSAAVAGLEQSMRDDIYQHLQRLEPGSTTSGNPASCCRGRPRTYRPSGGSSASASSS